MTKRNVFITGASGFIGRNLFDLLSKRNDLNVFGTYHTKNPFPKNKHIVKADLTSKKDVAGLLKRVDILIHAAATSSGAKDIINKPYYHVTDNSLMNSLILQEAHDQNVPRAIFFSCTIMYPAINKHPVKETDFNPGEEKFEKKYFGAAWTKYYLEKLCDFYSRLGKTKFTVIRHSNIYGPYDKFDLDRSHVFGATVTKAMTATDGKLVVWGEGNEERDLLYISDLVDFVELVINKDQDYVFDVFNVGLGMSISIKNLVKRIVKHTGKKIRIEHDTSKPSIATIVSLDTTKAYKKFGWKPKIDLDDGIKKTISWYNEHVKS